jgi:hypothetical protein
MDEVMTGKAPPESLTEADNQVTNCSGNSSRGAMRGFAPAGALSAATLRRGVRPPHFPAPRKRSRSSSPRA